jgi:hypothetical protein
MQLAQMLLELCHVQVLDPLQEGWLWIPNAMSLWLPTQDSSLCCESRSEGLHTSLGFTSTFEWKVSWASTASKT